MKDSICPLLWISTDHVTVYFQIFFKSWYFWFAGKNPHKALVVYTVGMCLQTTLDRGYSGVPQSCSFIHRKGWDRAVKNCHEVGVLQPRLYAEVSATPTSTTSVTILQSFQPLVRNGSQLPPRAAGGTSAQKQQLHLHRRRWKSITISRHKVYQLSPALRDFLLLVAAENKMLNK